MKTKTISLLSVSILALVLCLTLVSATLSVTPASFSTTAAHSSTVSFTFNLTNNNVSATYTGLDWSGSRTDIGSWSTLPALASINANQTQTLTAILTVPQYASGTINALINVTAMGGNYSATIPIAVSINATPSLAVSGGSFSSGSNITSITITNTGNTVLSNINLASSGDFNVSFSPSSISSLSAGYSAVAVVTLTDNLDDLNVGSNSATVTATASGGTANTGQLSLTNNFCSAGNPGELEIISIDIANKGMTETKYGDDNEWFPLEEIEVEVEVENKGDYDIDDIEVEWGLYDTNQGEWAIEITDEKEFNLKDGDEEVITFSFNLKDKDLDIDLEDLSDGENYILYVRATGEIDDSKSPNDGNDTCASESENDIELIIESDFVTLDNFNAFETVMCGSDFAVSAEVWNTGDSDQEDVVVYIANTELGISNQEWKNDVDAFDKEPLDILLNIPEDAEEKSYTLQFTVYDEDNDIYENSNDDKSQLGLELKVEGNCGSASSAIVSASLESGGIAGEELIVKSTVTNTGSESATYTVNTAGYTSWASSAAIDQTVFTLNAGASKEITITLNVKDSVSGDQTFNIEVFSDDKLATTQPVSVAIQGDSSAGITGGVIGSGDTNWTLITIIGLIIILVIAIIIVAIKVARK